MKAEKYEKLKTFIRKSNPNTLDLNFGCKLLRKKGGDTYMVISDKGFARDEKVIWITSYPFGSMTVEIEKIGVGKDFEIIGQPIRLADVTLALSKMYQTQSFNFLRVVAFWDLKNDDLDSQNEECLIFLYEDLKLNKKYG